MRARQLRSLILAALSLALAATLFLIYQYRETKTTPILFTGPSGAPAPTSAPIALSDSTDGTLTVGKEQVAIGGGGEMRFTLYDDAGHARGSLIAAEWRPLGERSTKVEVVSPRIRVHTPGGQIIDIASDRGVIERKSADLTRLEMKTAQLEGAVQITIDRLTDAQRAELDADPSAVIQTDRFIQLDMDDLFFDLEFARVQTDGPFHVRAAEAEIHGRGLSARYNELDSRVEELNIRSGERIVVWNLGDRFSVSGLNASDESAHAQPAESAPPPAPTPAPAAEIDEDLPPLLAEDGPRKPRERPTDVYTAIFDGDVRVDEYKLDKPTGHLLADHLRILFDFSQRERELARQTPGTPAEGGNGTSQSATSAIDRTSRIELTWSGPLRVVSERLAPAPEGHQRPLRVQLTATGERVEVRDELRAVECRKLVFRNESEAVELTGTADLPAHVTLDEGGELYGREITLNRKAGTAHAKGPGGRLVAAIEKGRGSISGFSGESDADAPLEVAFEDEVNVRFTQAAVPRFNIRTAQTESIEREYLESAVFTGTVKMTRGDERFEGQRIELDFALDPNGKQYPTQVRAFGDVVAAQGARYISARDRLIVDFDLLEEEGHRPTFNLAKARDAALDRGEDPDAIDWIAVREHYNSQRDYQPGLRSLTAVGSAEVRDPDQRLEIDCDVLECRFAKGREIQSGLVTPRTDGRAFVALGAFSISAPTPIPFDAIAQTATVDGPGRMTFPSKQDIDGRTLDEPLIVAIQWAERMAFDGGKNEAIFRHQVRAETERSKFQSENLRIDFEDVAPPNEQLASAGNAATDKWWVLQPAIDRATGHSNADEHITLTGPTVTKKPVFIYADGEVSGMTANDDNGVLRNRVSFSGPTLAVDLRRRQLLIDGAGTLLIEDYSRPEPDGADAAPTVEFSPFGRLVGNEPSQTFIRWEQSMSYSDENAAAEFLKDITLMHSTGSKMKQAAKFIGEKQAASGRGREAQLTCEKLLVSFSREKGAESANAGTAPMSGTEVDAFVADHRVHFADSGISAIANRITYERASGDLDILGTDDAPAELFDQRKRFSSFKGPRFTWNRKTNQILAPKSRGRVN